MANSYLDKAGLTYFYNKLPKLTESDVTTLINNALTGYKKEVVTVVSKLPDTGTEGILYMIPNSDDSTAFTTYTYEDNKFVQVGSASVDLSNYYNKADIDNKLNSYATTEALKAYVKASDISSITNAEIDAIMV